MPVSNNDFITFQASHDDISITYNFGNKTLGPECSNSVLRTTGPQLILCPEKIGMYGDRDWRLSYLRTLRNVVCSFFNFINFNS